MATGGNLTSFLTQVNAYLQCPICQNLYQQPKTLPCLHSFCEECLLVLEKPFKKTIECPVCGKVAYATQGVKNLTTDQKLEGMVEVVRRESAQTRPTCEKHQGKTLCVFCERCLSLICLSCLTESHCGHDVGEVTDASLVSSKRETVREHVPRYEERLTEISKALRTVERLKVDLEAALERSKKEVEDQAAEELARVTAEKHRMLDEIDHIQTERTQLLDGFTRDLNTNQKEMLGFLDGSRQANTMHGDLDFLRSYSRLSQGFRALTDCQLPHIDPNISQVVFKPNNSIGDLSLGSLLTQTM